MNFQELLSKHENKEIIDRLVELYPGQKRSAPGYRKVLKKLRSMEPGKNVDEMKIEVCHVVDDLIPEDVQEYENVSGVVPDEDISYAIEYTPWDQWLSMPLTDDTLKNYSEIDILAHCLWEMTWSGFEEKEIQGKMQSLVDAANQIREDHKEE